MRQEGFVLNARLFICQKAIAIARRRGCPVIEFACVSVQPVALFLGLPTTLQRLGRLAALRSMRDDWYSTGRSHTIPFPSFAICVSRYIARVVACVSTATTYYWISWCSWPPPVRGEQQYDAATDGYSCARERPLVAGVRLYYALLWLKGRCIITHG
ncbi:unnamed protein product [Strongylus vulgaris]|uniref:Uncharacterized protein n=1 Tax=Strongylus vulgaris TaxID=40348 RepID=A0A3P7KMN2_STRVU|nr:unnamed protein product [Strongylus vulgaris]